MVILLRRVLQQGNCVGYQNDCSDDGANSVLFTVTTADAQAALILIAAGLSATKCVLAGMGNYSHYHVAMSLLTLAASVLAFSLFRQEDYTAEFPDQIQAGYGDDIVLYKIAFLCAMIVGLVNAVLTYQALLTYKRVVRAVEVFRQDSEQSQLVVTRRLLRKTYIQMLLFGLVVGGAVVSLVAFGLADWETPNFGPANFQEDNAKLLMSAMILNVMSQGLIALALSLTLFSVAIPKVLMTFFMALLLSLTPLLANAGILYTVLARTEKGKEAGGLSYLVLIYAVQAIEFYAEAFRYIHLLQIEFMMESNDNDNAQSKAQQLKLHYTRQDA
ncbi:hypothetical protein ACA910_012083 [Epithemia clementina (nom. ined.)]